MDGFHLQEPKQRETNSEENLAGHIHIRRQSAAFGRVTNFTEVFIHRGCSSKIIETKKRISEEDIGYNDCSTKGTTLLFTGLKDSSGLSQKFEDNDLSSDKLGVSAM